jgi:hypothetical protein
MSLPARTENGRTPTYGPELDLRPHTGSMMQCGFVVIFVIFLFVVLFIVKGNEIVYYSMMIGSPLVFAAITYNSCRYATQTWECVAAAIVAALPFGLLALYGLLLSASYGMDDLLQIFAFGGSSLATLVVSIIAGQKSMMKRRVVEGQCPTCGYSTEGLPGDVCPECGEIIQRSIQ